MLTRLRKSFVRAAAMATRRSIRPEDAVAWDEAIAGHVLRLGELQRGPRTVHVYLDLPHRREVATRSLIERLLRLGHRVVVPVVPENGHELIHALLTDPTDLRSGRYGVDEPREIVAVGIDEIDLVLTPALAVDPAGGRLGYGGGYYDRFLARLRDDTPTFALIYDGQRSERLPVEPHDVALTGFITELGVVRV